MTIDEIDLDLKKAEQIAKDLRSKRGFQELDDTYIDLIKNSGYHSRLEILLGALEDIILIPEQALLDIISIGDDLEVIYSILILCRSKYHDADKLINNEAFDRFHYGSFWRSACIYSVRPTIGNMLNIAAGIWSDQIDEFDLTINLLSTVINAPHRIILYDIVKIMIGSGLFDIYRTGRIKKMMENLQVRRSTQSILVYKFEREELKSMLS